MRLMLPDPPTRPTLIDIERSPSPELPDPGLPVAYEGIELVVYGLDRGSPQAAAEHLRRLLREVRTLTPQTQERDCILQALDVRSADPRKPLDYAYLCLNPQLVPHPRADILQDVRQTLQQCFPDTRVHWRTQAGPDKTRRISFAATDQDHAKEVSSLLESWLERKRFPVLANYVSRPGGSWRVTFDLLDPNHVNTVCASPPVVNNKTYYPNRPRFIIPSYGYQVVVLGCRDWQCARPTLDKFIRAFCLRADNQDPIAYSRMELEGEVYTAVLLDWETTVRVADGAAALDEFLAQDPVGRYHPSTLQPGLLYGLNTSGLFARMGSTDRTSTELTQLRNELDAVRSQGVEALHTMFSISERTSHAVTSLGDRLEGSLTAMSTLVALQTCSAQAVQAEMAVSDLRQERNQCEMMLLFTSLPDDVHQHNLQRLHQCEEELTEKRARADRLHVRQDAISATLNTTLTSALTSAPSSVPAPASLPPPPYVARPTPPVSQPALQASGAALVRLRKRLLRLRTPHLRERIKAQE
ncbi:hypothetical protein LXA43DRAFT_1051147 [Ganoderma leucocontextum]|nr:hypothetical protein LXA43DRAFT_1051147 [Ganoderma leucocontextum]